MVYSRSLAAERKNTKKILYSKLDKIESYLSTNPNCEQKLQEYKYTKQQLEIFFLLKKQKRPE